MNRGIRSAVFEPSPLDGASQNAVHRGDIPPTNRDHCPLSRIFCPPGTVKVLGAASRQPRVMEVMQVNTGKRLATTKQRCYDEVYHAVRAMLSVDLPCVMVSFDVTCTAWQARMRPHRESQYTSTTHSSTLVRHFSAVRRPTQSG